jgi:hypothetical protein
VAGIDNLMTGESLSYHRAAVQVNDLP